MVFGEGGTVRSEVLFDVRSPACFEDGQVFCCIFFNFCCTLFTHRLRRSAGGGNETLDITDVLHVTRCFESSNKMRKFDLVSLVLRNLSCSGRLNVRLDIRLLYMLEGHLSVHLHGRCKSSMVAILS